MSKYKVYVDDNLHYMDEDERYLYGVFESMEAAVAACRSIVDRSLLDQFEEGMSSEELSTQYALYGKDPFVVGGGRVPFSAREYAEQKAKEICG